MTIGLHIGCHWHSCTTLHSSFDIVTGNNVPWPWYTLYSLFDIDILDIDLWSYLIVSPIVLHLHWLMKLIKLGLLGETYSRRIREVCLKGRSLVGLDATRDLIFLWFTCTLVTTCYMIPEYSELFFPAIRIHERITCLICSCPVACGTGWLH